MGSKSRQRLEALAARWPATPKEDRNRWRYRASDLPAHTKWQRIVENAFNEAVLRLPRKSAKNDGIQGDFRALKERLYDLQQGSRYPLRFSGSSKDSETVSSLEASLHDDGIRIMNLTAEINALKTALELLKEKKRQAVIANREDVKTWAEMDLKRHKLMRTTAVVSDRKEKIQSKTILDAMKASRVTGSVSESAKAVGSKPMETSILIEEHANAIGRLADALDKRGKVMHKLDDFFMAVADTQECKENL
eukprot:Clim_evm49s33 gene=Clim_evmTU49s33